MSKLLIFIKRFFRKLRWLFSISDWGWEYESCRDCGRAFRLAWTVDDWAWQRVMGKRQGNLCIDCFLRRAEKQGVGINRYNFKWLSVFHGDGGYCDDEVIIPIKEADHEQD